MTIHIFTLSVGRGIEIERRLLRHPVWMFGVQGEQCLCYDQGEEIELWTLLKNDKGGRWWDDLYVFIIFIGNVCRASQNSRKFDSPEIISQQIVIHIMKRSSITSACFLFIWNPPCIKCRNRQDQSPPPPNLLTYYL